MPDAHRFFQALADATRLRCLMLMVAEDEVCVCEMAHALGEIQPKISRHLAALRTAGFILDRREAQWIYYRLHPDLPAWMRDILSTCQRTLAEQTPFCADRAALASMPCRPQRRCAA
jgi:ArsR family transcriptional regulator